MQEVFGEFAGHTSRISRSGAPNLFQRLNRNVTGFHLIRRSALCWGAPLADFGSDKFSVSGRRLHWFAEHWFCSAGGLAAGSFCRRKMSWRIAMKHRR
jgi:hypothetical protein